MFGYGVMVSGRSVCHRETIGKTLQNMAHCRAVADCAMFSAMFYGVLCASLKYYIGQQKARNASKHAGFGTS